MELKFHRCVISPHLSLSNYASHKQVYIMDTEEHRRRQAEVALLEIFQRGHLREYFEDLSLDEQLQELDRLERTLRQNGILLPSNYNNSNITERRGPFYIVWLFDHIPVPIVNFFFIYQNITWPNIIDWIFNTMTELVMMILRVLRFTAVVISITFYFHKVIRTFFIICDILTFSQNFMRDAFTFVVQDYEFLLKRHEMIYKHKGDHLYFLQYEPDLSSWRILFTSTINLLSSMLVTDCTSNGEGKCELVKDNLIFKFSEVFLKYYPNISMWLLKLLTIIIFFTYALIGDFICLNIVMLVGYNVHYRIEKYKQVFLSLKNIIWTTIFRLMI